MPRALLVLALGSILVFPSLLLPVPSFGASTPRLPMLAARELRPGQKAVVRTVFRGTQIEEFEAEIVGVLEGGRAEGDLILARATSGRAMESGIALGMSGSPVTVDGKLIGALSGAWPFPREPLFAITPIKEMLDVLDLPSPASDGSAGPTGVETSGTSGGTRFGEFHWDDPEEPELDRIEPPAPMRGSAPADAGGFGALGLGRTGPQRLPLPLACAGLHPGALEPIRERLAPLGLVVTPGGRAASPAAAASQLEPGAACAIDLLRGDLNFSAIGTVTYRDGDRVLIFGHPMFQSGSVRLPLSTAEITTIVASQQASFKLGVTGTPVGVVTQDRRAAVSGTLGGVPRMLPLAVSIAGPGHTQQFRFETIEDRSLAPTLVAAAALNSLLESGGMGSNQTLRWTLTLHRAGAAPLALTDVVVSDAPAVDLMRSVDAPLRFLFNNPFDRLALDSVSVKVAVEPGRDQWTLRSMRVLEAAVRPGGRLSVQCEIERWRGSRTTRDFTVTVPREAPPGRYQLWLGGGAELSRYESKRLPGRYRPSSLDDAWRRLSTLRPSDGLYAALFAAAPEVTIDGRDYPELPVSALALFSPEQGANDRMRSGTLAELEQTRLEVVGVVRGELLVNVTVDPKAP